MLLLIFCTLFCLGVAFFLYSFYYKPKRLLEWYKAKLEGLGYKVKYFPFKFLGIPHVMSLIRDAKENKDPVYSYKKEYHKYDILLYNIMGRPTIQFESPELINQLFQADNVNKQYKLESMIQNIRRSLGSGIAFSEGAQWKRKRSIMSSVFNYEFILQNIPKISRICDQCIHQLQQRCTQQGKVDKNNGQIVYSMKMFELFSSMFSNVILQCFFGIPSVHEKINGETTAEFLNRLNSDVTIQTFSLPVLLFGAKFCQLGLRKFDRDINQRIKILRGFAQSCIDRRLKELQGEGPRQKYQDIIQALVQSKNLKGSKIQKISSQSDIYDFKQLIEQFSTFISAGADTTSHFTQMMVYYVSLNQHVQQKLRKQIQQNITSDKDITRENLKKLTYIDWIQNQTIRCYGPTAFIFTREAIQDHYIANIPIKKGMGVQMSCTASHYNEKYFKNPHQFRPERWEKECTGIPSFAFTGFGGGPRACIGKHLAMLQSKIALVKFIRRYKQFKLPKSEFALLGKFLIEAQPMQMRITRSD